MQQPPLSQSVQIQPHQLQQPFLMQPQQMQPRPPFPSRPVGQYPQNGYGPPQNPNMMMSVAQRPQQPNQQRVRSPIRNPCLLCGMHTQILRTGEPASCWRYPGIIPTQNPCSCGWFHPPHMCNAGKTLAELYPNGVPKNPPRVDGIYSNSNGSNFPQQQLQDGSQPQVGARPKNQGQSSQQNVNPQAMVVHTLSPQMQSYPAAQPQVQYYTQ